MRRTHAYKLRAFENNVLRRLFSPRKEEVVQQEYGENYVMESLIICTLQKILLG
jgi:hypothetical protein